MISPAVYKPHYVARGHRRDRKGPPAQSPTTWEGPLGAVPKRLAPARQQRRCQVSMACGATARAALERPEHEHVPEGTATGCIHEQSKRSPDGHETPPLWRSRDTAAPALAPHAERTTCRPSAASGGTTRPADTRTVEQILDISGEASYTMDVGKIGPGINPRRCPFLSGAAGSQEYRARL